MSLITLEQVQYATARCLEAHPAMNAVLPQEAQVLAELLGRMIYARSKAVEAAGLSAPALADLRRWGAVPEQSIVSLAAAA